MPRITVVEQIHFESPDFPKSRTIAYCDQVGEEQPYERILRIGPEWQKLDPGWLQDASLLLLHNLEGTSLQVQPTPEERDEIAKRVIVVGVCNESEYANMHDPEPVMLPFGFARPGRSLRLEPTELFQYRVRCANGTAKAVMHLFPR